MKLAVVGSINMDMTVTAERIPLKGETLRGDSLHYIPGGKGANQAVAMAKLGAKVEMFGCVGDDANGTRLLENFKKVGVETGHIKVLEGVPTGIAMITVGENDNTIIVVPGANGKVDRDYIDRIKEELKIFDMVVLQQEIPLDTVYYVVDFCYDNQIPVVLNPAPASNVPLEVIEKVTYVTPNEHEAVLIFGEEYSTEDLLREYPEKLIITQGSRGVITCLKNGEILSVPARKANVADTTGAGDTLNGAFALQRAKGADMDTICIGDCGLPIPDETERIDLAVKFGQPSFMDVLEEVGADMKVEKIILAEEMKLQNPEILRQIEQFFAKYETGFKPEIQFVLHSDLKKMTKTCKAVIRTGETTPYANIILQSGCIF